ncbi:hypothetical protein [Jiangella endophytica]|uniref:hypothetical protein n=1 Tax=Jiangella endophytica TaxID=1623398 RepID=UPI000E3448A0|nr:hypothetical protein [Jiangella endophytica]
MPWHSAEVRAVSADLYVSERGFRRHCLGGVGMGPKALLRILRFQGVLARAQASAGAEGGGPARLPSRPASPTGRDRLGSCR